MNIDGRRSALTVSAALAIIVLVEPGPLRADSRIWLAGVNYESTQLFAPVLALHSGSDSGREWNVWLTGWTLGADRSVARGPRIRWQTAVRVTPIHAHASNYIYANGRRDLAASYKASSVDVAAGLEAAHTRRWTGAYRLLAVYEHVGTPQSADVRRSWLHPFVGVGTSQTYSRVRSESLLGARWEGIKADAAAEIYTGDRTWSRVRGTAGGGKRLGPVFVSGRAALFAGRSLNTVSAFLIGGSWDLAPPEMLAGYRYGEFRVSRAGTLRGGVDFRTRGAWEIGARGSYLNADGESRRGAAIQVMTVWRGAVVQGGLAMPTGSRPPAAHTRPVVFASITAALVQR